MLLLVLLLLLLIVVVAGVVVVCVVDVGGGGCGGGCGCFNRWCCCRSFGHVHSGYGYKFHEGTHFINAAVLNEKYKYANKPITIDWDPETNELEFI